MSNKFMDLKDTMSGDLLVKERVKKEGYKEAVWRCICQRPKPDGSGICGTEVFIQSGRLTNNSVYRKISCGCHLKDPKWKKEHRRKFLWGIGKRPQQWHLWGR